MDRNDAESLVEIEYIFCVDEEKQVVIAVSGVDDWGGRNRGTAAWA